MEDKGSQKSKPGLEEAIHPEIGNDAAWESDPHALNLRSVDPVKRIESRLMDDDDLAKVVEHWDASFKTPPPKEEHHEEKGITEEVHAPEPILEVPDLHEEPKEHEEPKFPEEKKKKSKVKAGKLVRKVTRKVRKEEEEMSRELDEKYGTLRESSLSPFTKWLKGLTGSEYVHPYGDDYAIPTSLEQAGEGISETFADLLAAQGYKDQAIAMYRKLIEKFPEKSRFFAAKIEALQ